jgi:hypothetical protein
LRHQWRALLGALLLMIMLLMFASTVIYFLERDVQPEHFGSVPGLGLVGALQTLTTVGYGDVTPVTAMGKMFGGIVMAVRGLHVHIARRHHCHRFQSGIGAARIRGHLEHGGVRAAVQHSRRCRSGVLSGGAIGHRLP